MELTDAIGIFLIGALVLYLIFGIADFGGGILSGLSSGKTAAEQRKLIQSAIAPIWEANHVWLILALVLLFTAFPAAFRVLSEGLHIPLELMLIGIVLRGSAFVFRQYGPAEERGVWSRVFSVASFTTPFFLGLSMGALTSGTLRLDSGTGYVGWLDFFPLSVGVLTTASGTFLAAVYLTAEARTVELRREFSRRAYYAAAVLVASSLLSAVLVPSTAGVFQDRFLSFWYIPALAGVSLGAAIACLRQKLPKLARVFAVGAVACLVLGWGAAQYPYLIAPDLTLDSAAAPEATLRPLFGALVLGSFLVLPSLAWLLYAFKRD